MNMKSLPVAFLCLLLTSCLANAPKGRQSGVDSLSQQIRQPAADTAAVTNADTAQDNERDWEEQLKTPVSCDELKPLLDKQKRMRAELIARLERSTPAQADSLYRSDSYCFQNTDEFTLLTTRTLALVERAAVANELLPGDSAAIRMLHDAGCEIVYLGEGYAELAAGQYYYYNLFEPYLSEAVRRYAELSAYNNTLLFADAGLIAPADSIYARCLRWEEYMNNYPETVYTTEICEEYELYMQNILFCRQENTPTFEGNWIDGKYVPGRIFDYNLDEIRKLGKTGAGTRTNRIIAQYLDELAEQDYRYSETLEERIMALCGWMDKPAPDKERVQNE